jgi:hypothetical protein
VVEATINEVDKIIFDSVIQTCTELLLQGLMKMQSPSKLMISVNLKGFVLKSNSNTPILQILRQVPSFCICPYLISIFRICLVGPLSYFKGKILQHLCPRLFMFLSEYYYYIILHSYFF